MCLFQRGINDHKKVKIKIQARRPNYRVEVGEWGGTNRLEINEEQIFASL